MQQSMFIAALSLTAVALAPAVASAQAFPTKPVRIVAPYPPGGAVDLMARYLCERFTPALGQPCVVENRTGAGGLIGFEAVAKAEPDGHTLVMAPNNLAIIPVLYSKVPYDTLKDLAPVALVSSTPIMIGAHPSFPAKSFAELLAHAKSHSGSLNYTSCGPASPQHLAGEMLAAQLGFKWTHVPYKGCGPALADVLGNQVPLFISTVAHFNPQIKAGKLRGYAVLTGQRSQFAPEYPTAAESVPGYVVDLWFGLLAPGRTPPALITRLNEEVNKALRNAELREKLLAGSYEPVGGPPERFAQAIKSDMDKFGKVIKEAGIKAD